MKELEWPQVLPIIQSVHNHSLKQSSLVKQSPITLFAGLPPDNPLQLIVQSKDTEPKIIDEVRARQILHTEALLEVLEHTHKGVSEIESLDARPDAAVRAHNERTKLQPVNFNVRDFVLAAKRMPSDGHKLRLQ